MSYFSTTYGATHNADASSSFSSGTVARTNSCSSLIGSITTFRASAKTSLVSCPDTSRFESSRCSIRDRCVDPLKSRGIGSFLANKYFSLHFILALIGKNLTYISTFSAFRILYGVANVFTTVGSFHTNQNQKNTELGSDIMCPARSMSTQTCLQNT